MVARDGAGKDDSSDVPDGTGLFPPQGETGMGATQTLTQSGVRLDRKSVDVVTGTMRPMGDRIVVRPLPLLLSKVIEAAWSGKTVRGEVLAVGPGEYPNVYNRDRSKVHRSMTFRPTEVKVGQVVHLGGMENGGYSFPEVMLNGETVIIASEKDICGIES
jgi:co-chaperonin GroES (HSP10)